MKKFRELPQWLIAAMTTAVLIAVMLLLSFVVQFGISPSDAQESWGQFGDFLGGILNPLFSIIGLLALLHTIVLQSKELSKSTKELKASARALKRQNKHNARQQFDNNFFQLLSLNLSQIPTITLSSDKRLVGEMAFLRSIYIYLDDWDVEGAGGAQWIERFDDWRSECAFVFDTYIHSVSNIISFIHNSEVSEGAKEFAYVTLSSNLSSEVLTVLFLFSTFSPDHCWVRETLEESDFFAWCQMDHLNYRPVWREIGQLSRVEFISKKS
ncbi:hypothetical protein [Pseudomonas sp. PNPG3]|uniref:hypothetical protein n=1 Tax=Pseudomonas sp. PNPG3 TaxID=2919497 RepID=UPI001FFCEEE4|nr:hypothetical protein [Pseudomonas sp. PNPG3]MCK2123932.1 hypothetical protein [Pseudomonas sp. PNPG3]